MHSKHGSSAQVRLGAQRGLTSADLKMEVFHGYGKSSPYKAIKVLTSIEVDQCGALARPALESRTPRPPSLGASDLI